jgi:mRNA interferase RelE/StbE
MFDVVFSKNALEQLNKFPQEIKERIWNKIQQCKENPFHFIEHLEEINGFKLRVGDYRVILDVNNSTNVITVLKIGHRHNVYEN